MVGEKAEADALRATSPEIAENVEEEVAPELLRQFRCLFLLRT
jgi:hypothetical protein